MLRNNMQYLRSTLKMYNDFTLFYEVCTQAIDNILQHVSYSKYLRSDLTIWPKGDNETTYQTVHKTLYRIDQHEPQWKLGWTQLLRNGKEFLLNGTSNVNIEYPIYMEIVFYTSIRRQIEITKVRWKLKRIEHQVTRKSFQTTQHELQNVKTK